MRKVSNESSFRLYFLTAMASKARKNLSDAEKDTVSRVHSYFLSVRNPRRLTHLATGVSETTVTRCVRQSSGVGYYLAADGNRSDSEGEDQNEPSAKRVFCQTRPAQGGSHAVFCDAGISRIFSLERQIPTVEKMCQKCVESIPDLPSMSKTAFGRSIKSLGFTYKRTEGNQKAMMERPDIVAWRHRFLREYREYRAEERQLVFLDETWVNADHTEPFQWYGREGTAVVNMQPLEAPSGKGKRLVILNAGWEGEFLPNCDLVFIGNTKSADYHDKMNAIHFEEW